MLGIRGAQEVKPQPAAGTSRLRGGIIWPCQLLCPWAGGRHGCCLAGSKEEQWNPLSLLIPAMFVTHQSEPFRGSVLRGFSPQTPNVPCDRVRLALVLVSTIAPLLRTLFWGCRHGMPAARHMAPWRHPGCSHWETFGCFWGHLPTGVPLRAVLN